MASNSELWVTQDGTRWRVSRSATGEILGDFAGRAEAIQEARKIAQREPATMVKVQAADGSGEKVPLLGRDPAEEVG